MKKIIPSMALLFILFHATAQQQFEGTIVYQVKGGKIDSTKTGSIEVTFGKQGIRASYTENGKIDNEVLLFRFDSSALFALNTQSKEYTPTPLYPPLKAASTQSTIAGYKTSPVLMNPKSEYSPMGSAGAMNLHLANDLYYKLPDNIGSNTALFFLRDGRIVLGIEIYKNADREDPSSLPEIEMIATATLVNPHLVDPSILEIPAGFTNSQANIHDDYPMDSVMVDTAYMTDTFETSKPDVPAVESVPAPKPAPKTKPATPKKIKPKPGSAARKPD